MARTLRRGAAALLSTGIGRVARPPRQLVIFTSGRSGSQLLVRLLDSHPRLRCDGEILTHPPRSPAAYVRGRAIQATLVSRRPGGSGGADVYGWKLITNHLRWYPERYPDPAGFLAEYAYGPSLVVTLRRRDLLNQTLSLLHAEQTQFHFTNGEAPTPFEAFEVEPERLLAQLYYYEEDERWLTETVAGLPHLSVVYEDDLAAPAAQQETANRVFQRLGLPPAPVESELVSVAPPVPRGRIRNYDAVATALRGTRYEPLLEPV